ncbi:SGNH/GDSL hydrolase family protein [Flavobacterium azooxidireducens]|uniref:SGNH/GDSL hydrolase family protein n=1 Tax=Flavobacterium azooxidireducens TaxID=1871076 RepID=A0ABY4KD59_9FLAO|nr:SGNH/GDSL hydrolase family protein [Flavobacterium azooxidireducens]UPQ77693.1 SGNH/GDSL hydrolase family protein [Flavobacterium azooxidireducens]
MKTRIYLFLILFLSFLGCSNDDENTQNIPIPTTRNIKYLALGDSYTIGQSVCATCRFPAQLKDSLKNYLPAADDISVKVVAQTGWTTTNLKNGIANENLIAEYDLVTLLIGVNNQYQNRPFSLYETEFPELLQTAIALAKGDKNRVIVVSIPDYAFTPFGQGSSNPQNISNQLDQYNLFAKDHAESLGIEFVNITDITREGLNNTNLVASDNLHPSELAYSRFVERLLPIARNILGI